jgi:hypothetical protein
MEYLHYQLHVPASTLAIIRLAFNLSRDYTICMVCSGEGKGGGTISRFAIVVSMKIRTLDGVKVQVKVGIWGVFGTAVE